MTKFNTQMLYKNPQWSGKTEAQLAQLQSVIELRHRLCHDHLYIKNRKKSDIRLIINVSGRRFETYQSTLERYPNTLLGDQHRRALFYDGKTNEFFFDRHCLCFEAILYYYQSYGRLRRPDNVPLDTFLEEITFFDLGSDALNIVRKDEDIEETQHIILPKTRFYRHLWANLEYPQYSLTGKIFNCISAFFVLLSAIELATETLPNSREILYHRCDFKENLMIHNSSKFGYRLCLENFHSAFFIIQTICNSFFTIEFLLRLLSCPSYIHFIKSILNWIDLFAILPYYLILILLFFGFSGVISMNLYFLLNLIRIFRFVRVFKLYRNFQHVKSLHVLACTMKESIPDFIILMSMLTLCGFLCGAAMYFAENEVNEQTFTSIPKATYYGIMTITSVGYGDLTPVTPLGRSLACITAMFGITLLSMLASVLVDRYQRVYARKRFFNENVEEIMLKDSLTCLTNTDDDYHEDLSNIENDFQSIHETEEEQERKQTDQLSGKVRFIIGYVSDDEDDDDNREQINRNDKEIITKIAREILRINSK